MLTGNKLLLIYSKNYIKQLNYPITAIYYVKNYYFSNVFIYQMSKKYCEKIVVRTIPFIFPQK